MGRHANGFGSFELVWVTLAVVIFTMGLRLAGGLLGVEIAWWICALFGVLAPMVLLMLLGLFAESGDDLDTAVAPGSEPDVVAESDIPESPTGDRCLRLLEDDEGKRRVRIFRRPEGTFYYQEELFSERPGEHCWMPVAGGGMVGFYDSEETALREARGNIDWLAGTGSR